MITATIASGQSLSDAIDLITDWIDRGLPTPVQIFMPAAWTAAQLSFSISKDMGATYSPLYDGQGNEYIAAAAASRAIILDPTVMQGIHYLKLRSGTIGSPVVQAADRALGIQLSTVQ